MYEAVQQCKHCGAGLSLEDLRRPNCNYCGTVFPHHAQAAQHAQMASQVMGQMMQQQAQVQDQWRGAFGVGPMAPPPGAPGSPYGDPMRMAQVQMAQAGAVSRTITMVVVGLVVVTFVLVGAGFAFALLF